MFEWLLIQNGFNHFLLTEGDSIRKKNLCKEFEKEIKGTSEWKESNGQQYLEIEADNYYSLGYLEGKALSKQILKLKHGLALLALKPKERKYQKMARNYLDKFPEEYKEEMCGISKGVSETSFFKHISFDKVLLQNTFLDIEYGQKIPNKAGKIEMGCTSFGVKNNDGTTTLGQNLDLNPSLASTLSFVLHKVADQPKIFSLRVGSGLGLPMGKNEHGVYATLSIVKSNVKGHFTSSSTVRARRVFENATSAQEGAKLALSTNSDLDDIEPATAAFNMMGADKEEILSLQVHPRGFQFREGNPIVTSNRFTGKEWNDKFFADGNYSLNRQERAEEEITKAFEDGKVTNEELLTILKIKEPLEGKEDSEICRLTGDSQTLAFFTKESFGLGSPYDGIGKVPI